MSKRIGFAFVGAVTSLLSGPVSAQSPAPGTDASPGTTATAAASPGLDASVDAPSSRYPRDVMSRPLTYPAGLGAAGFDLSSPTSSLADPTTVRVLAGYGITDDIELNFGHYAFPTDHADKGTFDFGAGVKLVRGAVDGKLEIIARVQSGYNLATSGFNPLLAGLHAQYNLTPRVAVFTPGGQLSVGLAGDARPVTFGLPVSLGVQATSTIWLQLDTSLATLKIANASNAFVFADSTPVAVTAYVNVMPRLDVVLGATANLTPPETMDASGTTTRPGIADTLGVMLGARYYVGKL